jgi:hypothetical protein
MMGDWNIPQAIVFVDDDSVFQHAKRGELLTSHYYIAESNRVRKAWSDTPGLSFSSARAFTRSIKRAIL